MVGNTEIMCQVFFTFDFLYKMTTVTLTCIAWTVLSWHQATHFTFSEIIFYDLWLLTSVIVLSFLESGNMPRIGISIIAVVCSIFGALHWIRTYLMDGTTFISLCVCLHVCRFFVCVCVCITVHLCFVIVCLLGCEFCWEKGNTNKKTHTHTKKMHDFERTGLYIHNFWQRFVNAICVFK